MGQRSDGFVGVFDSGVGGISVLRALVGELPHEDFRFFGDSANAPYGEKTEARVLDLSRDITEHLLAAGAKAIVIACNTATSVAAATLRAAYPDVPIVGIDANIDALEAMKAGSLLGTVLNDRQNQSIAIINVIKAVNAGQEITEDVVGVDCTVDGKYIWVPYVIVDESNLDATLEQMSALSE